MDDHVVTALNTALLGLCCCSNQLVKTSAVLLAPTQHKKVKDKTYKANRYFKFTKESNSRQTTTAKTVLYVFRKTRSSVL